MNTSGCFKGLLISTISNVNLGTFGTSTIVKGEAAFYPWVNEKGYINILNEV